MNSKVPAVKCQLYRMDSSKFNIIFFRKNWSSCVCWITHALQVLAVSRNHLQWLTIKLKFQAIYSYTIVISTGFTINRNFGHNLFTWFTTPPGTLNSTNLPQSYFLLHSPMFGCFLLHFDILLPSPRLPHQVKFLCYNLLLLTPQTPQCS